MNKRILVVAASLLCATANAQSSVTMTGLIDAYVGSLRMSGDAGSTNVVNSGGMTTSWFGFGGSEDLGGGLKTNFKLTAFLRADSGAIGRFDGDPFFARDASVGLSGSLGSVLLGRAAAPNLVPTILANPFGDSFTFSPLILHSNVNTAKWTWRTTPSDTGWSNQVIYSMPSVGGLTANLQYQFGEQASNSNVGNKNNIGANLVYVNGPLTLVGYVERDQISNPVNPSPITATVAGVMLPVTKNIWMVGGSYDAGVAKVFLSDGQSEADITNFKSKTLSAGVSVPVGDAKRGSIQAAVARTEVSGPFNGTRTTTSFGYDHFLSKRTDLYAVMMNDAVTDLSKGTSAGFGVRHRF